MRMKYGRSVLDVSFQLSAYVCSLIWVRGIFIGLLLLGVVGCGNGGGDEAIQDETIQIEEGEVISEVAELEVVELTAEEPVAETAVSTLAGNLNLAWTFDAGGPINHPPLRIGSKIIAIAEKGSLVTLDAETGVVRWQYDPPERIWDRSYTSNGRYLFVGIEGGKLIALDVETGAIEWEKELGIDTQVPPLVVDEILYVPTTFVGPGLSNDPNGIANLFALSVNDGAELWQFESGNYILQTPFLVGDDLYLAGLYDDPVPVDEGGHTRVYSLAVADGSINWTYESEDGFPKGVYATETAVSFIGYQDFANGIDTQTGELLWRKDTGNWVPTLTGLENIIYFGSANTIVHALDMDDGHTVWQHNIAEGTFNYVLGAPIRTDNDLIFLSQHGNIMALNAQDGTLRWQFPTGITSRTGLSIFGNWLYMGDQDGIIYAYTE